MTAATVFDRHVLVTGHTGFKGSWLAEWLLLRGSRVSGLALPPETDDALFNALGQSRRLSHHAVDIRDRLALEHAITAIAPDVVFHMAAQPLVRRSYRDPLGTWNTNVIGTINLLEALRALRRPVTVVVVTTDKVYKNREWEHAYREEDELGGYDPYSASKAATELAVASWRKSFGQADGVCVVTARAGNVVGAGDVCEDRLVPDCYRAWRTGRRVEVRNPLSTRPWQHVLEPLSGYVAMAEHALTNGATLETCNFGPGPGGDRPVRDVVQRLAAFDASRAWAEAPDGGPHEAGYLALSIDKARHRLAWTPRLSFDETMDWTNSGYITPASRISALIERQIADYESRRRDREP